MSSPAYQPNPLTNLRRQIKAHWQEFRPAMYRQLEKSGHLQEALNEADRLTKKAYLDAQEPPAKMSPDQAWELVREEWAFLPEERKNPNLPPGLNLPKSS